MGWWVSGRVSEWRMRVGGLVGGWVGGSVSEWGMSE